MSNHIQEKECGVSLSVAEWRELRETRVIGMVSSISELLRSPAKQPFTLPGHEVEITDIRKAHPGVATHLVVHRFERRDEKGQPPNRYEERFTIDARRAVVAGHFKLDLTAYDAARDELGELGMRSVEEGLTAEEQLVFDAAKIACKNAKEERDQNAVPVSDLRDGEQFSRAETLKGVLSAVQAELAETQRADFSTAVLTHH